MFKTKRDIVFTILAGIFITNAVVAELIGGKIIQLGPFIMSIGIIPWPVVFLTTDLINEYYGKNGVKKLTFITASLIAYAFVVLFFSINIPAAKGVSAVTDEQFQAVFGQSMWIIFASIVAFLVSQFVDVFIFWLLRDKTGGKMIWLRSTGSTVVSQLIDTFIVLGIAFWLTGKMSTSEYVNAALTGYTFKLIIAIVLTPLIYLGRYLVNNYLGKELSDQLIEQAVESSIKE
ncbi:MAG: queuosine precursor transporter [Flavobacteriales bacterium]|nr:queuosine precursor transporter [Flavobacteriales bacterium]MCW8912717.1 queuosine precursor transporter [Flavobacteriales bacterium]MCW8936828.1 queuosine precursor transporter [Flavobacteriales bacterium]MCW8939354.1 queuosine precursor transporter [Flavobacteriales bacterium]MCW8968115.1 queuosine precursor transporter [Flavobacteriales bacterium]